MGFLNKVKVGSIKESLEAGVKTAKTNVSNIKVDEIMRGAIDTASSGAAAVGDKIGSLRKASSSEETENESYKEFIALLWCLAYADGTISEDERALLEEMSKGLDDKYEEYSEEIEQELRTRIDASAKEFGYRNAVKVEAQKIVEALELTSNDSKLLCWNLLALANSDGLDESEVDFVRFIAEKAVMDPSIVDEFRNISHAISENRDAIEKIERCDRSYAEVKPILDELAKREQVLVDAAQSLVVDR